MQILLFSLLLLLSPLLATAQNVQLGPRPQFLVNQLAEGELKDTLSACAAGPFSPSQFSIGHRGAPLQFPEHTEESYRAAAQMGAATQYGDIHQILALSRPGASRLDG